MQQCVKAPSDAIDQLPKHFVIQLAPPESGDHFPRYLGAATPNQAAKLQRGETFCLCSWGAVSMEPQWDC
eukprot:4339001-Pyramimonas_sp.AAC.1